jgi:glyoxylase-like metal-dependent hydrolase (beta-lactamase superfamily II)
MFSKSLKLAILFILASSANLQPTTGTTAARSTSARQLHLDVYVADEAGWNVTSTIIYGKTESILVDTQSSRSHANKLADRIAAIGTRLKAIVITHPHDDHYIGLGTIHERFPDVPIYINAAGLEVFKRESADNLDWLKKNIPAEAPESLPTPQVLSTTRFLIDGQPVEIMQGQGDESKASNSYVWIPSLRALVTGDMIFNQVHVWLANSTAESRATWLQTLQSLSAMHPRIVVGGHKKSADTPDSPAAITFTADYIRDFEAARVRAHNADEMVKIMKEKYSDAALADKILTRTARRAFPKQN